MFKIFRSTEKKLEDAKNKLISDLKKGDVSFVLQKMESDEIYSPLLNEIRKTSLSTDHQVSTYAYIRATEFRTEIEKGQLMGKLAAETSPVTRRNIYYGLSHLCHNTNDKDLFQFLMEKVEKEDESCRRNILMGIQDMEKGRDFNIEPLKRMAQEGSRSSYWGAILALRNTHDPEVEGILLSLFEETSDKSKRGLICLTLKSTGTEKCIPILKEAYKKTRDNSLKWDIEEAISGIEERRNLVF